MTREEIIAANPLARFLGDRGYELRPAGRNFVTNACPVALHKKYHRPVSIDTKKDLWHCNDCEKGGTIIDWLMLEKDIIAKEAMRELNPDDDTSNSKIVETYDYADEAGKLLFQCVRLKPKDFRQRRPDGKGGWIWNMESVRRVLYRLPDVIGAQIVCVAEGEKDCDNLVKLGFVATTNPLGAGNWRDEYAEALRGKDVIVFGDIGDPDGKGEKHTAQVLRSVNGKAHSLKHAIQADGFHDISDWIAALPQGEAKPAIVKLVDETPLWTAEKPKKGKKESAASQLVRLVVESRDAGGGGKGGKRVGPFSLFHDPHHRAFARYHTENRVEIWPVESARFRKILATLWLESTGTIIGRNALSDAITTLAGLAIQRNPEEPTFLRVAPYGDDILIDLCDENWRVVLVTAEGWQVLESSPAAFVRTGSMLALPEPRPGGGSIEPLWELLNVTRAQRPLVAAALLNAFHPSGPYFVSNYLGEHGSAKSSAARIHRQLIDPNQNPLRSPPKEENDLFAQSVNNRCVALDNLSHLSLWLSDAICRIATGGGLSKRTLYTDFDETSLEIKRPVIINGIEDVATRPDLADRVLQIELQEIPKERRITEKVLWQKFDKAWPMIFTAILDGVSMALRTLPALEMPPLPRMADATEWATAGETAFGFSRWTFLKVYQRNLDESAEVAIDATPVGAAIRVLLDRQPKWEGQPRQLLEALNELVSDKTQKQEDWPKNAQKLGQILRRIAPALRRAGIDYQRPPREADRRIIKMRKVGHKTSQTSSSSGDPRGNDVPDDHDNLSPSLHALRSKPQAEEKVRL